MESREDSDTPKEILLNMLDFEGRGEEGILNVLQACFMCSCFCLFCAVLIILFFLLQLETTTKTFVSIFH